ncbi:hypothetical protein COJ85_03820 [Bacillus sp. AFS076308]|uniref:hypothetical protein n=1 Tax=Bacillus sp. AFS037270 TaxID=2033499 RepID=UPI000BF63881|nr:hypothetical protein [Bacillus sp. AFS037270]PFO08378.1 hypothetical protein COJ85_03820 [Bacillus sp. AFS076308]PGV50613.1 hypothetical protein COD92_16870 [Bacillus sp. AFS037270]
MLEERLLRYAVPALYDRMADIFAAYHIHPYDVHATAIKEDDGYDVSIRFAADFSQVSTKHFTGEQVKHPGEDVTHFFQEAAETCKSFLITDYFKMMKQ